MSKLLTRRFAPEPYSVQAARRVCLELIGRIEPSVRDRMGLLVSELVSDSVRRLSGRAGALIGIDIQRTDRGIRVRVTDPDDRPEADGLRPLRRHGRSLIVVSALADDWGFGEGPGTEVWFELCGAEAGDQEPGMSSG